MTPQDYTEELVRALKRNKCARVGELIANGADINRADAKGMRPLQYAAVIGCARCLRTLLGHGAETADADSATASTRLIVNGKSVTLTFMDERGARAMVMSEGVRLPLHHACLVGDVERVCLLLQEYPHTVNAKMPEEHDHATPLHVAAQSSNVDCIELLLQHGAKIEAADEDGKTPLHIVAFFEQMPVVKCLLEKGARATVTDNEGRLPLHIACLKGHVQVACLLLEKYPDAVNCTMTEENMRKTPLYAVAENGNVDCIELLLQHGANIGAATSTGATSLHIAAVNGQALAVKCLLEK